MMIWKSVCRRWRAFWSLRWLVMEDIWNEPDRDRFRARPDNVIPFKRVA